VQTFYDDIKASALVNTLYTSPNTKLFSSIDYMTNDGSEYSKNPSIPYYIYYNLVPKSLDFELVIPFMPQSNFKTNMSILGCDIQNKCPTSDLIPFVFSYQVKDGKIVDPLFEIDDVNNVKKIDISSLKNGNEKKEDEGEEKKEGFSSLFSWLGF